jgi:hypothetical protein
MYHGRLARTHRLVGSGALPGRRNVFDVSKRGKRKVPPPRHREVGVGVRVGDHFWWGQARQVPLKAHMFADFFRPV